jgi:acyl-CoA thioesterase
LTGARPGGERSGVGNPFLDGTVVRPAGPGRYEADIDEVWNLRPLPQGGVVTVLAVRAMEAALAEEAQRPRTLHTTFAARVAHGPVDIDVEVLRRGRTMSQARAEVRNRGAVRGHLTTAVFGTSREGFDFTDLEPPLVPPPEECESYRTPPPPDFADDFTPMPFWEEVLEGRNAIGHPPWDDAVRDRAERATWFRFDEAPVLPDGTVDPLALIVLADVMPGAVGERVGPNEPTWFAPSIDLTVHLLDDCRSTIVLGHNRCRFAGDGYASADMALWDCGDDGRTTPRLVAYATQLFLFSFME